LTIGFLSALEARPDVSAKYTVGRGGTALCAAQQFMGRRLAAGKTLELDPVYLAASDDPYTGLERYGDAVAAHCRVPIRKGATSLWCSWYAYRMAMTEDLVLANAAIMAQHFKPLGMDIVQMDHGWQQGDLTGNWMTNERFPHGLKWLAEQLRSKYGLKLGIWIAPTYVAETSELFKQHADWMLKDDQGKPKVNWKWYWKPNPDCYELDASNPEAAGG
jgi:alpha-galactosidase